MQKKVLSVSLSALNTSGHHLCEIGASYLFVAVVIETFYENFPIFAVKLRHSQSSHHVVHLMKRESASFEEVSPHLLLKIELSQFEVFEQLMQFGHLHFLSSQQPLQLLPVAGSLTLAHLLTQLLNINPAIATNPIYIARQQFLQDAWRELILLLGKLRFCITQSLLIRN